MSKEIGFWLAVQAAVVVAAAIYGQLAHADERQRSARLAQTIALQGNTAVRDIRADVRDAVRRQARLEFPLAVQQVVTSG
jgi:hypothetical protein